MIRTTLTAAVLSIDLPISIYPVSYGWALHYNKTFDS